VIKVAVLILTHRLIKVT